MNNLQEQFLDAKSKLIFKTRGTTKNETKYFPKLYIMEPKSFIIRYGQTTAHFIDLTKMVLPLDRKSHKIYITIKLFALFFC